MLTAINISEYIKRLTGYWLLQLLITEMDVTEGMLHVKIFMANAVATCSIMILTMHALYCK